LVYRVTPLSAGLALGGLAAVLLPAAFARQLLRGGRPTRTRRVNLFDRRAIGQQSQLAEWTSNIGMWLGIAAPIVVDWLDARDRRALFADGVVYGQALALNGALNTAVKYIVQRPLPETYAGIVRNRRGKMRGYRAFYSGHVSTVATALAFGCLTARMRHGRLPWRWPWIVSAVATVVVGVGRILSGKHFPTDVLVAAPVGATLGTVIPIVHARDSARRSLLRHEEDHSSFRKTSAARPRCARVRARS
jgi:membrane-associated phospholipid phosphatase